MQVSAVCRTKCSSITPLEPDPQELCCQWLYDGALFLDTETTGLGNQAEIVELAVVNSEGDVLIDTLIKPTDPIPYQVTKVHGITNDMVEDAPAWPDIHDQVSALLYGRTVIAYNSRFDSRILGQTCGIYMLPPIPANWYCAMRLYQKFSGNRRWVSLLRAAGQCGIALPDQAHRALADTMLCLGVVQTMAKGG